MSVTRPPANRRSYPDDHGLFIRCLRDTVRLLRAHASLALWCAGNELGAASPPLDIVHAMRAALQRRGSELLDGTRPLLASSTRSPARHALADRDGPCAWRAAVTSAPSASF